jgi:tetratricopeptide (TPR) repeat protein
MNTLVFVATVVILAICVVGLIELVRRYRRSVDELRQSEAERITLGANSQIIDTEKQDRDGETVVAMPQPPRPWHRQIMERPAQSGMIGAALLALLGLAALLFFFTLGTGSADRYVVLVAPFDDGGDGQTGRNVAENLVREINGYVGGNARAVMASGRPANAEEALAMASAEGGDLLLWGRVEPGAILDSASLTPNLIYTPNGPYAPNSWDGYLGRFAMPRSYTLAREPINGRAVLPPYIAALYAYASGNPDKAFGDFGLLLDYYPSLTAPLPRAVRGNVLWARTFYGEAANEYRLALGEPADEQALLANNLGAILLDANDPASLAAFQEAVRLLGGRDLGELRFNLATLALRENRSVDAMVELEQARNLLPPQAPLLLALAGAYRDAGRLEQAEATLEDAGRQIAIEINNTVTPYRAIVRQHYDAARREEEALLNLSRQLGAQGELFWELEVAAPQTASYLNDMRRRFDSAADTSARTVASWRRLATSDSVATNGGGLVATGQAERAEISADRQRFYRALIETELARVQGNRPRSALDALFGVRAAAGGYFVTLEELQRRYPDNARIVNALGRARRLNGELDSANSIYDQSIRLAPQAPEGYFGKGVAARALGDRQRAAELYNQALERNNAFFPSRYELASLAQESGDWAAAIEQRRLLYQQRPGPVSAVALAQELRKSGPSGHAEAEQVLLPLSATDLPAAIELARLYNDAGRPDAAISAYTDALTLDSGSSAAAFELGETYVKLERFEEAESAFKRAVQSDSSNVEARLALADLYQGPLGQPQLAESEYRAALSQGVDDVAELAKIGAAAMATRNYGQAVNAYGEAVRIDPNNAALRHELGQAYFAARRLPQAAEQENFVLTLAGDLANPEMVRLRASALTTLGDVSRLSGDIDGANSSYSQALQLSPNLIAAEIGLGLLAVGQGNWGVATGYFQSAANMPGGSDDPMAQFWLGEALLRQNSFGGATSAYNRALELQPLFPEAYLGLAQVQYAQGGRDAIPAALETAAKAVDQKADYAEALLFRGKLYQELGDADQALVAYNASIRANDRIAEAYYRRGMIEVERGDYAQATRDFRQATSIQSNFPEAYYWLGRAYYADGDSEAALRSFQQAMTLNGNYLDAIFYVGLASEDLGRTAEALSAYQTVIAIDATSEYAERARASIDRLT